MGLKDLQLKPVYYSDVDNLLVDFYIPVLSESIEYKRIAGYFCSNTLALITKGLTKFITNGGKIELIANVVISEEDQEAIKKSLEKHENKILTEIEVIDDELKKDHIKLFSWLLKNKKMEIRIAVVKKGIEHQKIGIMKDSKNDIISFSGSENETMYGWLYNDEQFHVFCNWIEGDLIHLKPDIERFDTLWNNEGKKVRIYPISEAFKQGLIRNAPKNTDEFNKLTHKIAKELIDENNEIYNKLNEISSEKPKLRAYQKEAVNKWIENSLQGIFEMATGVGKTFTALGCLDYLSKLKNKLVTIIVCPYNHLINQWKKEILKFNFEMNLLVADSSNKFWKNNLANYSYYLNKNIKQKLIVLTTYNTFSSNDFIDLINNIETETLVIADEMHWSGAKTYSNGLIEKYDYRIGLSATPERYFDESGTKYIIDYFGSTIYNFDLKRAINEINPDTGKSYLTPYNYNPIFCELNDDEFEKYIMMSKKIARMYFNAKNKEKEDILQLMYFKRQKIIINASEKLTEFEKLIQKIKDQQHILIYCTEKQICEVQKVLNKLNIINHRFTGEEGTKPKREFGYMSKRDYILKNFANGTYKALVAMKCLDEGIDVPQAKTAIILASSGNPKEYIQRRGRILRRYAGKEKAIIYDLIVVPSLRKHISEDILEIEKKIFNKELKRYEEFGQIASNSLEVLNLIFPIKRKYKLI